MISNKSSSARHWHIGLWLGGALEGIDPRFSCACAGGGKRTELDSVPAFSISQHSQMSILGSDDRRGLKGT